MGDCFRNAASTALAKNAHSAQRESGLLKQKSRPCVVISVFGIEPNLGGDFAHRLDALGAQNFVNLVTLFHHNRLLQVGSEGTIGGALGK